jgi:hypothetical protein
MRYGHAKLIYGVLRACGTQPLKSAPGCVLVDSEIRQDFLFLLHERLQESMVLGIMIHSYCLHRYSKTLCSVSLIGAKLTYA